MTNAPHDGFLLCRAALPFIGLCVTTLVSAPHAPAQLPDLLEVRARYMPSVALRDPRPAEVQVSSYDAAVNVPIPLREGTFVIPGIAYHVESVSFSNTPPGFTELRAFHSIDVTTLFVQLLPNRWALSFRLAPGVAGDFRASDSGLLRLNAVALATRPFSDRLVLGGGGIANFSFGTFLPLPAAYLEWSPSDRFRVETFIPAFLDVRYTVGGRLELGLRADVAGNSYALRDERVADVWPCAHNVRDEPGTSADETRPDVSRCVDHIAYSTGTAGAVLGFRVHGDVWVEAAAGHSFFRRFEQMNEDDDRVPDGLQNLPDAPFIRAGLVWRIPTE